MTDERGYTIIELLVTMVLGLIIVFAGAAALETYQRTTADVEDRTVNQQASRLALDQIMQSLRSQACPASGASSLLAGSGQLIDYVTDLGNGTTAPERRVLQFDASRGLLTEQRYPGTRNPSTQVTTFATAPSATRTLLDGVRTSGAAPVFSFYAYDQPAGATGTTGSTASPAVSATPLPVPLSAADTRRVARIQVLVKRGTKDKTAFSLQDQVTMRSVDPADSSPLPQCP